MILTFLTKNKTPVVRLILGDIAKKCLNKGQVKKTYLIECLTIPSNLAQSELEILNHLPNIVFLCKYVWN